MSLKGEMKFRDFIEAALDPAKHDYAGRKFENFLRETKNMACPGCGETGLYEYAIVDPEAGMLQCPRCLQLVDLRTVMRSWVTLDQLINDG